MEIIQENIVDSDSIRLFTDASGIGIGGFYDGSWFSLPINNTRNLGIAYFELLAVLVATMTWGANLSNKQILILSDNESICQIWFTGSCKDPNIMSLVRKLFFFTAKHITLTYSCGMYLGKIMFLLIHFLVYRSKSSFLSVKTWTLIKLWYQKKP